MNKNGELILGIIAIILALTILAGILVSVAQRECKSNRDCPDNAYCNTNYECVEYPNEIIVENNNFLLPSIILGVALITSAYIFKGGKLPWKNNKKEKTLPNNENKENK